MQKRFKQLMLLAALVPTFAMAQSLQSHGTGGSGCCRSGTG